MTLYWKYSSEKKQNMMDGISEKYMCYNLDSEIN